DFILRAFESGSEVEREILAYALVKLNSPFPKSISSQIEEYLKNPDLSPVTKSRLNLALILWDSDPQKSGDLLNSKRDMLTSNIKSIRYEYSEAMAIVGNDAIQEDLLTVLSGQNLLKNETGEPENSLNLDCQSAAAFALIS